MDRDNEAYKMVSYVEDINKDHSLAFVFSTGENMILILFLISRIIYINVILLIK